jgi:hypothetical protein
MLIEKQNKKQVLIVAELLTSLNRIRLEEFVRSQNQISDQNLKYRTMLVNYHIRINQILPTVFYMKKLIEIL